ncbi:MAG TPA: PaaI family thioesterase [Tepidiformaceae bacterium]|nr:PaaI family thioesterase [Tepidiformaceae bacterium]
MVEPDASTPVRGYAASMDELRHGHSRWLPDDQPPAGQRAALHRLAAAVRRLNELLMDTEAPEEDIIAGAGSVETFCEKLEVLPRHRILWGYAEASNAGDPRAFFDNSPVIGMANPIAPPVIPSMDGTRVEARVTFGAAYEGPPGHVHGGWVAAAFDEVLGMVQSASGNPGMTGTLTVKYRRPTPLYKELRFEARLDRVEGRKIFTHGSLWDGETLCAEAEGIFISVDFGRMRNLAFGAAGGEQ